MDPTTIDSTFAPPGHRRRTPGPSAPASWTGVTSFDTRPPRPVVKPETISESEEARWKLYEGWCEVVLREFIGDDQLPWDIRRRRGARRGVNRWATSDARTRVTENGPPPLVDTVYGILSRSMGAHGDAPGWLADADVKRFLGTRGRVSVMLHGVWRGCATWRGVRDCASGEEGEGEGEGMADNAQSGEWDADSGSETNGPGYDHRIEHLFILDFSFIRFHLPSTPSAPRAPHRPLARYLADSTVRRSVRAISFAGADLTLRQAVDLLAVKGSSAWSQLESVSLAGLRSDTAEDVRVAVGKLARACPGLEVSVSRTNGIYPIQG